MAHFDRVLIVGGYGEDRSALTSAEIFDPATGAFSATGSLAVARGFHTAILLSTGEVLIIGGYGTRAYPNVAPAELYNPSSGVFRTAGASVGRGGCDFCAPSVLLSEGTVLFPWENPAQLYDPLSDSFSPSGSMSIELSGAALLTNGRVLFAGGAPIARVADAELYNPVTRTFARTGDMTSRRVWHTLTALPNGMALAAGGETDSCAGNGCTFAGSVASAELYDPTAGRFSPTGNMAVARETHTATLLGDGRVLMAGGVSYGGIGIFGGSLASVELYTPGVLVPTPALVALSGDGHGQGAIFHAGTSHVASAEDPSSTDADVDIYCRGLTEESVIVPRVVIGGRIAAVSSVTKAPDVAGVHVLRLRVPRGITPGTAVPVRLIHMDRPSNVVTMGVR